MLFDVDTDAVRLSKEELNELRARAAKNGIVIGDVKNAGEALGATLSALPKNLAEDMLQFLETGSSPMTNASTCEELEALWTEALSTK